MHIKGHWLTKNRLTRKYLRYITRLHDIHHHYIISGGDKEGLLPYNLGISTPMFDRVFGTYLSHMRGYSRKQILTGYKAGLQRYKIDGENNEDNKETITPAN
jgi:sterol desaturase/sphingolipid hydroxylase (fatty acid hydroxylase superfamily)